MTWKLTLLCVFALGCDSEALAPVTIHSNLAAGADPTVADMVSDLAIITGLETAAVDSVVPECEPETIRVSLAIDPHLAEQAFSIRERRCDGDGRIVYIRGGSLLSAQWGGYDFLERLGIRYFHPEHTFYPDSAQWPDEPFDVIEHPAFFRRSMRTHRTHPIELSAPLVDFDVDMEGYQKRYIDWHVKRKLTDSDGWDLEYVGTYAWDRGFPRTSGFNLLNTQQGGRPILDPDDPRPESEQLADAIEQRMAPIEGYPPVTRFGFQFNPSEFTEADHQVTVDRIQFIANYMGEHYPDVRVQTINHGTHMEPGELGVRFFDLPQFGPPNLDVQVHTLMFYDLERSAAGVYGNDDFSHLLQWTLEQQAIRRIIHYPEGSWWLTFDLPVPLYLAPVTLDARQYDIDLLADYRTRTPDGETGIWGHHLFSSGQEWGYWLIDYCVAEMTWDLGTTASDCLDDFTDKLEQGDEIRDVLREVTERQVTDLRDPEILRFLVGSDDETETAYDIGVVFHPLPPRPGSVLSMDDPAVSALTADSLDPLRAMAADYHAWADRIDAVLPAQSEAQAPWVREIRDGLRVFAFRAEHTVTVYETSLELRTAVAGRDLDGINAAAGHVDDARAITEAARVVVRAREADYRYPEKLTIEGGEPGTEEAVDNKTIYPYRYLTRTHNLFYWTRPDDQLGTLFGEGLELVQVPQRILEIGTALDIGLLVSNVTDIQIDWGDGTVDTALAPHTFSAQGFFDWVLDAAYADGVIHHEDKAVVVTTRVAFPKGSLHIEMPDGAEIVGGLLPGFVVGLGDDGAPFMVLGRIDGDDPVAATDGIYRRARTGNTSGPADLDLELSNIGALTIFDAIIELDGLSLSMQGELETQQIVDLLVSVGGFDEPGARDLVASVLGYTADTLPARVSFVITAEGS